MSGLLVAILFAVAAIGVTLVLPIISFLRTQRALRELRALRERVDSLASQVAAATPHAAVATSEAVVEPPPRVPVAPTPAVAVDAAAVASPALPAPPAPRPTPGRNLEQTIGSRWLLYAGVAAVVLGMSYFVKYAFDSGWISEPTSARPRSGPIARVTSTFASSE